MAESRFEFNYSECPHHDGDFESREIHFSKCGDGSEQWTDVLALFQRFLVAAGYSYLSEDEGKFDFVRRNQTVMTFKPAPCGSNMPTPVTPEEGFVPDYFSDMDADAPNYEAGNYELGN